MSGTSFEPSRTEIWKMFDTISQTYDKANRWMTFGLDLYWRKKVGCFLPKKNSISLLDCATGTGDQIFSLVKNYPQIEKTIGIDLSEEMLKIAQLKLEKTSFSKKILFQIASILEIPFPKEQFDCITLSFGIRNVTNVQGCLLELFRVLKPGGRILILETSRPTSKILLFLHTFYIRKILPFIGWLASKKRQPYQYLNQTAETFPSGKEFCSLLEKAGFINAHHHPITFGAVSIYQADKSNDQQPSL